MYYTENDFNYDMVKLAGAAGLIAITNDENADLGLRKQASDTFDAIASTHPSLMGDEFVKVAFDLYGDAGVQEVLAGYHLDETFEKVASITNLAYYDDDTLFKVASDSGASPVAAKSVAHELADAASNVDAVIDNKKREAEERPGGAVRSGGENVNNMEGYNPLHNPSEYDIEVTAAEQIQQAQMLKQASFDSYLAAEKVLNYWGY